MKLGIGFIEKTVAINRGTLLCLFFYIELLALPYTLHVQIMIVCSDFFTLPSIELNNSKCCPVLPQAWVPANAGPHAEPLYMYEIILFQGFGQEFFFVSASVCHSRDWNSRSNSFVRAPSSGGGSNAPRPAVSVPHIDVNADGCQAIHARSCKSIACRGGIPEILVVSSSLQRLDDLQNWHHFKTVVSCYFNVLNFAVAYSQAFVLLDVSRA